MKRETRTFETPGGRTVVIKTYLTAREANSIKEEMLKQMKLDVSGDSTMKGDISGAFVLEQEKRLLSILVESIGGYEGTSILDYIQDEIPYEEYQAIVAEVNKISLGNFNLAK